MDKPILYGFAVDKHHLSTLMLWITPVIIYPYALVLHSHPNNTFWSDYMSLINSIELWNSIANDLKQESTPAVYELFISKLSPYDLNDAEFVLLAPDDTTKQTIDHRYIRKIESLIKKNTGKTLKVAITLGSPSSPDDPVSILPQNKHTNTNLLSRYTFDTFVKGKSNEFAFEASCAVAESPGHIYNPLFL